MDGDEAYDEWLAAVPKQDVRLYTTQRNFATCSTPNLQTASAAQSATSTYVQYKSMDYQSPLWL